MVWVLGGGAWLESGNGSCFIRVPYMNPTILGGIGPGFLNQVPTLRASSCLRRWAAFD